MEIALFKKVRLALQNMIHDETSSYMYTLKPRLRAFTVTGLCRALVFSLVLACQSALVAISHAAETDITAIPLEELPNTSYIPASRIAQQLHNASSAVAIVTAQDIRDYGYRNLGEILNSMRGLIVTQDYEYTYVGGRGYSSPGEYAGRVLLFIDGYRAQDGFFEQGYFGQDGLIDVNLIDRVEYVAGPGAAGYGDGASLGVINVYTKKGGDINGAQVASNLGSHGTHQERFTFGKQLENGADVLLSGSVYNSDGRDFSHSKNTTIDPSKQNNDHGEDNIRLFLKANYQHWFLETAWVEHDLELPTIPISGALTKPFLQQDDSGFVRLRYDGEINDTNKLLVHGYYGFYRYQFDDPEFSKTITTSKWHGLDTQIINTYFKQHTLMFGVEYRHDARQDTRFIDLITPADFFDRGNRTTYSLYGYDDFAINTQLNLNFGARYTASDNGIRMWSPRAAIIYKPLDDTTLKLSSGVSRRQATPSESGGLVNRIDPELTRTTELTWEQDLGWQSHLTTSLYRYSIAAGNISGLALDPPVTSAKGLELQYEKIWAGGTRLRTSWARQHSKLDNGQPLAGLPKNVVKLNLSAPLLGERLRTGLDVRSMSKRRALIDNENDIGGYTIADLTFSSQDLLPSLNASFSIKNLFDRDYGDVVLPYADQQPTFPQVGRNYWLQLEYTFK